MRNLLSNLFIAIIGGLVAISLYHYYNGNNPNNSLLSNQVYARPSISSVPLADFTSVAEIAMPTVVHIKTKVYRRSPYQHQNDFWNFFGRPNSGNQPQQPNVQKQEFGSGSGVIVGNNGYIITNNHVIEGADEIEVILHDKRIFKATIRGIDPTTDLAMLKINASNLQTLSYGNSDNAKVGEWVMAVGNPFKLASTVTTGIISAKARNIGILENNWAIESFIQTDAAVNPGNSGGALVNLRGELIGINTAIATPTGTYAGYSFAIPSNIVKKVANDLIQKGSVSRAFLGLSLVEVDNEVAEQLKLTKIEGVYVARVAQGGGAYNAGIREGDIITHIAGKAVNSTSETLGVIGQYRPNDEVDVTIKRKERISTLKVQLMGGN